MEFEEIREFTYLQNIVIINGEQYEIKTALKDDIYAVQYHKETGKTLEEPNFKEVPFSKYSFCVTEWEEAKAEAEEVAEDEQKNENISN